MTNFSRTTRRSLLGLCLYGCFCATPAVAQDGAGASTLSVQQERDIAFLEAILVNQAIAAPSRVGAADRLIKLGVPQAVVVLDRVLREGAPAVRLSVITAMSNVEAPVPGLLDGAVHALRTAAPEVIDQLGLIVTRYEGEGLIRVVDLAHDSSIPVQERVGAIHALGYFPTRASGDELIELADPFRGEHEEIRVAAFDSLRRLSPADFGNDFNKWRTWWQGVRDMSQAEWARELIRQYQDRNAELERRNSEIGQRLVDTLRGLHRMLDVPAQLERISKDLDDPLVSVRDFTIGRVERLLRDSVTIPDPIRAKLVERLDDADATIRLKTMTALDQLDEPNLAEMIAARLPNESDHNVLIGSVQLLTRRPTADAFDALVALAGDEAVGVPAAEALWAFVRTSDIPIESRPGAVISLRDAVASRLPGASMHPEAVQLPALVRLLAFIGDEPDVLMVEPLLDDDAPALRRAVAEGFAVRGRRQPLLDRVGDPAIFPSAVDVIAAGPADLANFQLLVGLTPPDAQHNIWAEGVRTLAKDLSPQDRLDADRALRRVDYADAELRSMVLLPLTALAPDALAPAYRVEALATLTPLLITHGEAQRAYEILDSFNGIQDFPELEQARFCAALCANRYETGAQLRADPESWLQVLDDLIDRKVPGAQLLSDEIARRFGDTLGEGDRAQLDAARRRLEPTVAAEPSDQTPDG